MKKGKRLLVVLLATLVMMVGAVGVSYAEDHTVDHDSSHNAIVTATDGKLEIDCDYHTSSSSDDYYCEFYNIQPITITPASDLYYNGGQKPVTVSTLPSGITKKSLYYTGTQADGTTYARTSAAPINAGTYTASLTLDVDGEGEQIITKTFKILPREVSVVWSDGNADEGLWYTYDRQSHLPTVAFQSGAILTGDTVTLSVDESQAKTDAGTNYPVEATVGGAQKDNYSVSGLKTTFEIRPATAVISAIEWTPTPATHVYDGKNWAPTAKGTIEGTTKKIDLTVQVVNPNGGYLDTYKNAGNYTAKATGSADADYSTVTFKDGLTTTQLYKITPCPVSIDWAYASQYVYNGQPQEPTATVEGLVEGETVAPKVTIDVTNKTTQMTVAKEGEYAVGDIKSIHAGNFNARVVATVLYEDGLVKQNKGLLVNGEESKNYMLEAPSVSDLYTIKQKLVDVDWYRPNVDPYGDPIEGADPVVKIEDNSKPLNLVYNGQQQAPTAQLKERELIAESVAEGGAAKPDVCTVSVQGPTAAVKVGRYDVQKIGLSNNDYDCLEKGRSYNIVPRPVHLKWEHYHDIYNGEEQGTTVTITNPQYRDTVTAETEYPATNAEKETVRKHFGSNGVDGDEKTPVDAMSDTRRREPVTTGEGSEAANAGGSDIVDGRTPIDAGLYTINPGPLSDPDNYTYFKLDLTKEADEVLTSENVALYQTYYMIHQFVIADIDWSKTTTTYNASYQLPVAKVNAGSLKGGDTNTQVELMLADSKNRPTDNFAGYVNAGEYTIYIPHNESLRGIKGERSMNYLLADSITQHQSSPFIINKRPLKVIANPKTIWYKDEPTNAGVRYVGLINGTPNETDDLGGGKPGYYYKGDTKTDVILGTPEFTYSYAKNGKPGTYKIYVSGITSDNYDIQPVAGDLTVLDRYDYLNAQGTKKGSKGIRVSWNGVTGATSYDVYMSMCNTKKKKYTPVYVGSTSATSLKVTKIGKKKLKKNTAYKYYVVAKNAGGAPIAQSERGHFITNNVKGKKVNAKSMSINTHSVTIAKGGTAGLSASYKKAKKGKKLKLLDGEHAPLTRFASENPAVATVDANGVVYGVGTGWTRVYVIGVSGMWQTVEVYVQ